VSTRFGKVLENCGFIILNVPTTDKGQFSLSLNEITYLLTSVTQILKCLLVFYTICSLPLFRHLVEGRVFKSEVDGCVISLERVETGQLVKPYKIE
jgi:hypothetical protein